MLVPSDSILRRLPENLNVRQVLFYDGIRYSLDMADEAYVMTRDSLLRYSEIRPPDAADLTKALLGAWSFVDCVHRLHMLLRQTRGMKNTPQLKLFKAKLAEVEDFRHGVQHLDGTLQDLDPEQPAWGCLAWFVAGPEKRHLLCTAVPGSTKDMLVQTVDPFGKELRRPLDLIELDAFGKRISLTDLHDALIDFTPRFEKAISIAMDRPDVSAEKRGSDMFVAMEFEFTEPPTEP